MNDTSTNIKSSRDACRFGHNPSQMLTPVRFCPLTLRVISLFRQPHSYPQAINNQSSPSTIHIYQPRGAQKQSNIASACPNSIMQSHPETISLRVRPAVPSQWPSFQTVFACVCFFHSFLFVTACSRGVGISSVCRVPHSLGFRGEKLVSLRIGYNL